jgi:hypothetical protein
MHRLFGSAALQDIFCVSPKQARLDTNLSGLGAAPHVSAEVTVGGVN